MKKILLLAISVLLFSCKKEINTHYLILEPKAFSEKLQATENPQLIDVRSPEEFNEQHLDNAKNINVNDANFDTEVASLDKTKPVFVYCKSGGRSKTASEKLQPLGFNDIIELSGGLLKWEADGMAPKSDKTVGLTADEYQKLIQSSPQVLIDFNAKWCGPCQQLKPTIEKLAEEFKGKMLIKSLDVDENKSIANDLKIESIPLLILYKNGKEIWRNEGLISEEELRKHL